MKINLTTIKIIQFCLIGFNMLFAIETRTPMELPKAKSDFIDTHHRQLMDLMDEINCQWDEERKKLHQLIQYVYDGQWSLTEEQMNMLTQRLDLFSLQDFSNGPSHFFKDFPSIEGSINFFEHPLGFTINYNYSHNIFELYGNGLSHQDTQEYHRIIVFIEVCNKYKDYKQKNKNIMEGAVKNFNKILNDNKSFLFHRGKKLIEAKPWKKIIDIKKHVNFNIILQNDKKNQDIFDLIFLACLPGKQKETTIALVKHHIKNETIQNFFHRTFNRHLELLEESLKQSSFNGQTIKNNILFSTVKTLENPSHDPIDSLVKIWNICGFNGNISITKLKELWNSCVKTFLLQFYFAVNCDFKY